jgi:NADH-quinone oxidoreductase subunit N
VLMEQDLSRLIPFAICAVGGLMMLIVGVFTKAAWLRRFTAFTVIFVTFVAVLLQAAVPAMERATFYGVLFIDSWSYIFQALLLVVAALVILFSRADYYLADHEGEYFTLLIFATLGAMILVSAAEFVTLFIGLEMLSLSLYALCGGRLLDKRSIEGALKYFLLGSFSSAILLYGLALLYGLTGTMEFVKVSELLQDESITWIAFSLVMSGLFFKLSLVPFQFWTADTYQGAPTPITAFMATAVKIAAIGVVMRVLWVLFNGMPLEAGAWIGIVAAATLIFGNLVALRQSDVKRMLAYSGISHAGYLALALLTPEKVGSSAIVFYVVAYSLATLGAFAVVQQVEKHSGTSEIKAFNALAKCSPLSAATMTIFMLSLAGLPPALGGLLGKFFIFNGVISAGFVNLAVLGIVCAVISCGYYLRVVVAMYFRETDDLQRAPCKMPFSISAIVLLLALSIVLIGVVPDLLLFS